jgi:hypothetical protein
MCRVGMASSCIKRWYEEDECRQLKLNGAFHDQIGNLAEVRHGFFSLLFIWALGYILLSYNGFPGLRLSGSLVPFLLAL